MMVSTQNDWPAVEAAAKRAGWTQSRDSWWGPCPITGEGGCFARPGKWAPDGVVMGCKSCQERLGRKKLDDEYHPHKAALLALSSATASGMP